MERIAMSNRSGTGWDWLKRARDGKMTQREAASGMGSVSAGCQVAPADEDQGRRGRGARAAGTSL